MRLNRFYRGAETADVLRAVLCERIAGEVAVVSSFGAESAVLLHLVARVDPSLPVLFLDTGKHFPETLAYRDQLVGQLGLTGLRNLTPDAELLALVEPLRYISLTVSSAGNSQCPLFKISRSVLFSAG